MTPAQSRIIYGWLVVLTLIVGGQLLAPLAKWDGKITLGWPSTVSTGPRLFVLVHESADDDAEFSSLKVGLRKDEVAKPLAAKGHRLEIIDQDQAEKYKPKEGWPKLPAMVTTDGGKVLAVESLPAVTLADTLKIIEKHGGPLK